MTAPSLDIPKGVSNLHALPEPARDRKIPHAEALAIAQELARLLTPACDTLKIAGSVRREKPLVKDIELVAIPKVFPEGNALLWLTDQLVKEGTLQKAEYTFHEKVTYRWGEKYRALVYKGMRVDLFLADADNWGYIYWLRTGSGEGNQHVVTRLKYSEAPFHIHEGNIYTGPASTAHDKQAPKIRVATESQWFEMLNIPLIPPPQREEAGYLQYLPRFGKHIWGVVKPEWVIATSEAKIDVLQSSLVNETDASQKTLESNPSESEGAFNNTSKNKQQSLFNLNALYDPIIIKKGEKEAPYSPAPVRAWEWKTPYLDTDGLVWVRVSTRGTHYTWEKMSPLSDKAIAYGRTLARSERQDNSDRDHLVNYLNYNRLLTFAHWVDIADLPAGYFLSKGAPVVTVNMSDITPTQEQVIYGIALEYWQRGCSALNADKEYPVALRFNGDSRVYLVDGHHRYTARLIQHCKTFEVRLIEHPITLPQALGCIEVGEDVDMEPIVNVLAKIVEVFHA